MGQDQASADAAARQYVNDISNAFAERARQLELINTQYATDLAALVPGALTEDGTAVTPQYLYVHYLDSRAYTEKACNEAVAAARTKFLGSAGPEATLPRIPDEAIRPEPAVFPAPPQQAVPAPAFAPHPPAAFAQPQRAGAQGRRPRMWPAWTLAAVMGVAILWVAGMYVTNSYRPTPASADARPAAASSEAPTTSGYSDGTVDVLYEVEGTATGADLTLESATGTSQQTGKAVPLRSKTTGDRGIHVRMPRGHFVYLSAQNTDDTGSITCKITVDGVLVASNTSSGGYAIASCSGTAE